MDRSVDGFRQMHADHQAAAVGTGAAPALVVVGLIAGIIEGSLTGSCEGMECLWFGFVALVAAAMLGTWAIVVGVAALTRRRWTDSTVRLWLLRLLAAASWAAVPLPITWT